MAWKIEFDHRALKEFKKLDRSIQKTMLKYLKERIATADDPRLLGKALADNLKGLWRYRVGNYRIICQVIEDEITILVLRVGHRRLIYE